MTDWEDDYEPDPMDGYEPDPTNHPEFERYERDRYMRTLSPLGRVRYRVSSFIWHYTWRWRIKTTVAGGDEPPF